MARPASSPGTSSTLSLRLRILIVALLPLLVAVGLFAAYFAHRSINEAEDALTTKGRDAVRRLAEGIAFDYFTGNLPYVKRQMDLEYSSLGAQSVAVADGKEWILLSGAPGPLPEITQQTPPPQQRMGRLYFFAHPVRLPTPAEADPYLDASLSTHSPSI